MLSLYERDLLSAAIRNILEGRLLLRVSTALRHRACKGRSGEICMHKNWGKTSLTQSRRHELQKRAKKVSAWVKWTTNGGMFEPNVVIYDIIMPPHNRYNGCC